MAHTLAFHLIRTSRQVQNAIGFKEVNINLSPSEASALLIVDSQKETSQIEIAIKLHLKPASVVSLIDDLEKLNLVKRQPHKNDRRRYLIQLTPEGNEQVKKIRQQANRLENFVRSNLTALEVKTLFGALEKISSALELWPNETLITNINRKGVKNEIPGAKRQVAS